MKTKLWFVLALLVILATIAPQPTQASRLAQTGFDKDKILEDGKITIAWIPKALNNPVFEIGRVGAETKAAELTEAGPYEVEINYTASVASDAAEQARVIEDAIASGVEAIGVSCNDPTGCIDPINKAIEAGIPVMTWDSDSPDSDRFTYLGVDNYEGGKAAADLMKKALPDGGKVALLTGVPGAFNLEERIRGFKDGVEGTNIEVIATVACDDDINKGVQVVEETMQANPDLNGWFFVGLWPLFAERGSMPLWEEASASGNLKTVAFDTLPVELEYLQEGLLYGLVGQKYWGWGYDTTQMIYDTIVDGKQFDSFTNSGMDIVGPGNVDIMAEAWANNDFTKPLPLGFPTFDKDKILEDGKITIAWIPKALNNPVFEVGRVGAETKAAELTEAGPYEVEINYTASVASDAAEQARVIEDAVAAGVEAIGVSCNDPTACVDPINNAIDAGIPVMTWDSDSPDSDRFTYLGVDNYEGGKAAAELMIQALPDGGKVALLTGVPGAFNLEERIRGFKDGVAGTNIEVVATVACDDDINKGVQVVEETMQANPDLNGWFFVGLWPLFAERGSMPLWEEAAASGNLKTVAFDTLPVELDYLKEGLLYGLVGQKYWGWGYDTTQMIYDTIVDGKQFEPFTNSGMDIVGPNNVDVMSEAWANNDFTKELPPAFE